mmetsp:Transcript_385/g.513  ORF Transcript_385/g.513 Transcript_385/m.513 type:complete len:269 (+) Transcript_385:57-863(+)
MNEKMLSLSSIVKEIPLDTLLSYFELEDVQNLIGVSSVLFQDIINGQVIKWSLNERYLVNSPKKFKNLTQGIENETYWHFIVSRNPRGLMFAPYEIRNNRRVVLDAIQKFGFAIQHASIELQQDAAILKLAIEKSIHCFKFASDSMKNDKELVLNLMQKSEKNSVILRYCSPDLQEDAEVVCLAVSVCGRTLEFAGPQIQKDLDVVGVAVREDGLALRYAAENARADKATVLAACQQNGLALKYAATQLQNDAEVVNAAAVSKNNLAC